MLLQTITLILVIGVAVAALLPKPKPVRVRRQPTRDEMIAKLLAERDRW